MYAAYVGLVAVTNLLIGFKLAVMLGHRQVTANLPGGSVYIPRDEGRLADIVTANEPRDDPDSVSTAIAVDTSSPRIATRCAGTWAEIATILVDQATSFESVARSLQSRVDTGAQTLTREDALAIKQQAV